MKYEVRFGGCGHTETISFFGPEDQRRRKIAAIERNGICSACRAAANIAVAEQNKEAGLVALEGTPKQIAWAESVRAKLIPGLQAVKAKGLTLPDDHNKEILLSLVDGCIDNTSASWWIDNRDYTKGEAVFRDQLMKYVKDHNAK